MRDRWIGIFLVAVALILAGVVFAQTVQVDGKGPMSYVIIGVFALLGALLLPIILKKLFGEGIWKRLGSSILLVRLVTTFLGVLFYVCYVLVTRMLK